MAYVDRELAAESALSAVIALDRSDLGDIGKVDEAITKEINKLPTIDGVRHGKWENPSACGLNQRLDGTGVVCSVCQRWADVSYDFCPNCGADMADAWDDEVREAIMRLSMCACRECEICKYKSDAKGKMPTEECKERSRRNASLLAEALLRRHYE